MIKITTPIYLTFPRKTKKDKTVMLGMNWYRNAHYIESNNAKVIFKSIISEQVSKLPVYSRPITIHYNYRLKRKGSDLNNIHGVISKFFPDCLVELWKLWDDTTEYIVDSRETFMGYDKENPRAEIVVSYFN